MTSGAAWANSNRPVSRPRVPLAQRIHTLV